MKCPKCKDSKELWKVKLQRARRTVELGIRTVIITCPCGYNFVSYIENKDLVAVAVELRKINKKLEYFDTQSAGWVSKLKPIKKRFNFLDWLRRQ